MKKELMIIANLEMLFFENQTDIKMYFIFNKINMPSAISIDHLRPF